MIRYLLDTNVVIGALQRGEPVQSARLRAQPPGAVAISTIVLFELYYGSFKSGRPAGNVARADALPLPVLVFERADARAAGRVRAMLETSGKVIGPMDILIAGQALARGLTLVTANTSEFSRVEGLALEDWSAP